MENIKSFFAKNEIVRLAAILCLITSVTALLLGVVNDITAPIIEEIKIKATNDAMKALVTEADNFTPKDVPEGSDELVLEFYEGTDETGVVGYCVKVNPYGYGGPIEMVVALDASGAVIGNEIIKMSETPGLGTKIVDDTSFGTQFIGKNSSLEIVKGTSSAENQISAISGATISSTAMTKGISTAINFVAANK